MKKFIKLNSNERKNLIQKAANDLGLRFDIVEKDIWVCYVLQKLFSNEKLNNNLIFKGGTCLSKAYDAIGRFSEDDNSIFSEKVKISGFVDRAAKDGNTNAKKPKIFFIQSVVILFNILKNFINLSVSPDRLAFSKQDVSRVRRQLLQSNLHHYLIFAKL